MFLVLGAVSAADSINVSKTEDSNLIGDNDYSLSAENKLEISSEDSISETNMVNSHDDNLGNYQDDEVLNSSSDSSVGNQLASDNVVEVGNDTLGLSSSNADSVVTGGSSNDVVSVDGSTQSSVKTATSISTKLTVTDTHYSKSGTSFKVTLKDKNGKTLANQKITLVVKKKSYSAFTNKKGIASIKTAALAVGTYAIALSYEGNGNYSSSSLSKKVKVSSSLSGSDLTKYYGYISEYKVQFWKDYSVLSKSKVSFKVNGKTYTRTTDKNGVAILNVNLDSGKYVVTITNPYSKEKLSKHIVVKKDNTKFKFYSKTYFTSDKESTFTVTLKSAHGVLLKDAKVSFTFNNDTVTLRTDANGKASMPIPVLAKGTYKISFKYSGDKNYYSKSDSARLIFTNPTTKVSALDFFKMNYNDGSKFRVKLTTIDGQVLANKYVELKLNGKYTFVKTDANGIAKFSLKNVAPGLYKASFAFCKKGERDFSSGSSKILIFKSDAFISGKDIKMLPNDGSTYDVTVKDKNGKVLSGVFVKSSIAGKSYIYQTNSKGVAKLKITAGVGYYTITSVVADPCYKSGTLSKHVTVKGKKFVAEDIYVSAGNHITFSVKLVHEKNGPVKNAKVKFTFKGKSSTAKTNANGIAKIKLGVLSKGIYKIKFSHRFASGSAKIHVVKKVSLKDIIKASKEVRKYISKNSNLPSTVKIGNNKFSTPQYLYLASKAIVNLKNGVKTAIPVKNVKKPTNLRAAADLGYLSNYKAVAQNVVKFAESKGRLPDSVSSDIGIIGYKGLVSAFSRTLAYYGDNNKMPSYIDIKSLSSSSSSTGKLNSKNTISDLAAYLAASTHCDVNNAQIKQLVYKLTKNCKTDREKANAIFNYVRDTVSYSFYYDTKYGAVGTLKARTGNCVDHSHLLVAMYRASGLAARYAHGTCTFSSGGTYGHVWTQVLLGDTWTVADATSTRNSLGNVVNWNANSYSLKGYFSSIAF